MIEVEGYEEAVKSLHTLDSNRRMYLSTNGN